MSAPLEPRFTPPITTSPQSLQPVVIAGAGIIGLSIALELHRRGIGVCVLDRGTALGEASIAAAGMLASEDPHNPPALRELARFSRSLYPAFLERIAALSGLVVPVQTSATIQYVRGGASLRLDEESIDPRQLATALLAAVRAAGIDLQEKQASADQGQHGTVVIASGAWSDPAQNLVAPRKGQMLRVALPPSLRDLREVHRAEHIYIVPRTQGPQAGSALIGATVEDAGFDKTVQALALAHLRALAAEILPALASESDAPVLESWAGLRPGTPDGMPLLGKAGSQYFATGHFRNGILLAPATAVVIADLIEGKTPAVDISPFAPQRFSH
jgi:glycine oxidase